MAQQLRVPAALTEDPLGHLSELPIQELILAASGNAHTRYKDMHACIQNSHTHTIRINFKILH